MPYVNHKVMMNYRRTVIMSWAGVVNDKFKRVEQICQTVRVEIILKVEINVEVADDVDHFVISNDTFK